MPNPEKATHFLDGVNNFVPDMQYHSDVLTAGITRQYMLPAPPAASATAIVNAASIAAANDLAIAAAWNKEAMGEWGRAVVVVLSGAGTPTVTVRGRDYLGQPMREDIVAAGAVPVLGKKAFKYIDRVTSGIVAATTLSLGTLDIFGVPFCADALIQENVNDQVTANAGTFTPAVKTDPQTATTGDPRGTYAPHTNNAANGVRTYRLVFQVDKNKLHGVKHYYA